MDGRTHAKATLMATIPVGLAAFYFSKRADVALAVATGCLCGVVIHPDLDLRTLTWDEQWALTNVPILGRVWAAITTGYSFVIPRHRHWLSHWPGVGTITRAVYFAGIAIALARIVGINMGIGPLAIGCWATGLAMADVLHFVLDEIK